MDKNPFVRGMVFPLPVIGTIRLGSVRVRNDGKRIPQREDHFSITTLVKRNDAWEPHPIEAKIKQSHGNGQQKLTEIPVQLMTNAPDLVLRARYEAIRRDTGEIICAGDGCTARRRQSDGSVQEVPCPGEGHCSFGELAGPKGHRCKFFGRLNVQIEGQDDTASTFILRTTSVNTLRTVYTKLMAYSARFGGLLRGIPFKLVLRGKTTAMSLGTEFFYVDLALQDGVTDAEAVRKAKKLAQEEADAGLDQQAFEEALRQGLAAGAFDDGVEDYLQQEELLLESDDAPAGDDEQRPTAAEDSVVSQETQPPQDTERSTEPASVRAPHPRAIAAAMRQGNVRLQDMLTRVP